eukprot:scaffold11263_cov108-Isochrysis_galbana.AAC.4
MRRGFCAPCGFCCRISRRRPEAGGGKGGLAPCPLARSPFAVQVQALPSSHGSRRRRSRYGHMGIALHGAGRGRGRGASELGARTQISGG